MANNFYDFESDGVTFHSSAAARLRQIYAPLCGTNAEGLKSAITPYLAGDIKLDRHHYLTRPASREDLRAPSRNFFVLIEGREVFSLTSRTAADAATVTIGQLWHQLINRHSTGLSLTAVNFIPVNGDAVELMRVTVRNDGDRPLTIAPTFAVPVFARALSNKHDHEHVTALLNRVRQVPEGVVVAPTMAFDERGHKVNASAYYVTGFDGEGGLPLGSFPTMESFVGADGTLEAPSAVLANREPEELSDTARHGKEACGALRFQTVTLAPGEARDYVLTLGVAAAGQINDGRLTRYNTSAKFAAALDENQAYWRARLDALTVSKGQPQWDGWMRWVTLQPILRRIFGCSFLPDHDYGKGGRGWRDLWQDLLSLILIEPETVRSTLIHNFAGVRIDGSNATIIGERDGEFIADRNAISRVWMDHGAWPFSTILLYIHQTGDTAILWDKVPYFRDAQWSRNRERDTQWTPADGAQLMDRGGQVYKGSVLEHVLVQTLCAFFNVGEHNVLRLESADWNDGLDMAAERGESVAFSSFYAGNLLAIADLLDHLRETEGVTQIPLARELLILLDTLGETRCDYNDIAQKTTRLFSEFYPAVQPRLSGAQESVEVSALAADLRAKGQWLFDHVRRQEVITVDQDGQIHRWVNGYYDNQGRRVEGARENGRVWMTLTGQVFPLMSGLADAELSREIAASVDRFLRDPQLGGYHLNTDFGVPHDLDLGRAFGFAYGTKENGAFFSHMIVMYAYALYRQGLVREGHTVLRSIYRMVMDTGRSQIYPNIPEYFDGEGRGMYGYLTGAASWLVLTELTQVFGVRGHYGDLVLAPRLVKEEFGPDQTATAVCSFADQRLRVTYYNPQGLDWREYEIATVQINGQPASTRSLNPTTVLLSRQAMSSSSTAVLEIRVGLGTMSRR